MDIELSAPIDCLCDFTYDFFWQHDGRRMDPSGIIPHQRCSNHTYEDLVYCLKQGKDVHIMGDAGRRLGSSLGVDLKFFGGTGESVKTGSIIVHGDVDTRVGISMVSGAIYVKGTVKQPLGNVIEVVSDRYGYRKFRSITGMLKDKLDEVIVPPNYLEVDTLMIKDGLIRDTIGARLDSEKKIILDGNAGMSAGILMRKGFVRILGDAGKNTGVLMRGGNLIVNDTEEFAGAYMKGGTIIIAGKSKGYVGANMKSGSIYYRGEALIKPLPPDDNDIKFLIRLLGINRISAMMFKKYVL